MASSHRNIYVGMAVSVASGVLVISLWSVQSVARLNSPFLAAPIPFVMGFAGSFWWGPRGEGPGLFRIILMEILGIGLFYAAGITLLGGWNEVTGLVIIAYLGLSPFLFVAMLVGAWIGLRIFFRGEARAGSPPAAALPETSTSVPSNDSTEAAP